MSSCDSGGIITELVIELGAELFSFNGIDFPIFLDRPSKNQTRGFVIFWQSDIGTLGYPPSLPLSLHFGQNKGYTI